MSPAPGSDRARHAGEIRVATTPDDFAALAALVTEYVDWCRARYADVGWFVEKVFGHQSLEAELSRLHESYAPPKGRALLYVVDGEVRGAGAWRVLPDGASEMKRLFVPERFQRQGIGRRLCAALIESARSEGYAVMRLDTGDRLSEAIALYESFGFRRTTPYLAYPTDLLPFLVFMERPLTVEFPDLAGRLHFIREAERLKNVLRKAFTSEGRHESTAEHTWRLCLMAMTFADCVPGIDLGRTLKLCVVHDLGEAIHGDIPAIQQHEIPDKAAREREDLLVLMRELPTAVRDEFLALYDEYEHAASPEARLVKGLDKLETIIQHNQGANPPDFNYAFNLAYGAKHTGTEPLLQAIRQVVDEDTRRRANEAPRGLVDDESLDDAPGRTTR